MRFGSIAFCLIVAPIMSVAAQAPALQWGPAPMVFPAGAKMAVLQGDPGKAAIYTVRLDMPDGYRIPPHWHPTDEHITVISGNFVVGMGDKMDAKMMMSMADKAGGMSQMSGKGDMKQSSMAGKGDMSKMMMLHAGDFVTAPATAHHYAMAKGHTIVQVHGMGPFQLTYVNPMDDPMKMKKP
jgi:quercetin dioxygenase-like cupin family protein